MKVFILVSIWSILAFCTVFIEVAAQTSTPKATSTSGNKTATPTPATTPTTKPELTCEQRNSSCGSCTEDIKCFWCGADSTCKEYPTSKIVPRHCKGNKWYWKQCVVPGYVLIIVVPSLAGLILITCCCTVYCCCCRNRGKKGYEREEDRISRRREDTRQRNQERRSERKQRTDAIRQKYGLLSNTEDDNEIV